MNRIELNSFLKEAGFASSGDLIFMEPERSETREIRAGEKAAVVTIATRARDRHGDILDAEGVRLDRFRKNPVVLYAHEYDGLPIARSLWERVRDGEIVAKPQFHLDTQLSREVWALVEKGVLSAWSVGFIPEKWEPLGLADGRGFRVKSWDLLEYSCVPVPANFEALTHALKERRITAPALVKSLEPLGFNAPDLVPQPVALPEKRMPERTKAEPPTATPAKAEPVSEAPAVEPAAPPRVVLRRLDRASPAEVSAAVARAFERVVRRARGEGV